MPSLHISLLGPFQAQQGGKLVRGLTSEKIQALLAYLALENDRIHGRDELAAMLWPDKSDKSARQNMRQALTRLQKAIGAEYLQVNRSTIQWGPEEPVWLDTAVFSQALDFTQKHPHKYLYRCRRCAQKLDTAASLYRGDFLSGLYSGSSPFEEWALLKREWFRQEALHAFGQLTRRFLWLGEFNAGQALARRQIEMDPLREEAHQHLIIALARNGRVSEALRHYHSLRRLLREELDVDPATTTINLFEQVRHGRLDELTLAGQSPPAASFNLPHHPNPFVGREEELAQVAERLDDPHCRLLTLVGPGGGGKSRLATQIGQEKADEYRDGVHFVPLAAANTADGIVTTVADVLDLSFPPSAQDAIQRLHFLCRTLRRKAMLLLLDNLEHLLAADETAVSDTILTLLQTISGLQLLITSRQPLQVQAEWVLDIGGLSYSAEDDPDALDSDAAQLFAQTARRQQANFTLNTDTIPVVNRICQLVAGMPLALELAASWIRVHDPAQIAVEIDRSLDFLASTLRDVPERHRSLRAVFAHSWDLLDAREQELFRRLAIFRGGFTDEAVAAITGSNREILTSLVAKSLVQPQADGRYDLHELLRQYAGEELAAELEALTNTRQDHAGFFMSRLADQATELYGPNHLTVITEAYADIDNIRQAWSWSVSLQHINALMRAVPMMAEVHFQRSLLPEVLTVLTSAAQMLETLINGRDADELVIVDAELAQAAAIIWQAQAETYERLAQYPAVSKLAEKNLRHFELLHMTADVSRVQQTLCKLARTNGDFANARAYAQTGLSLAQSASDENQEAAILTEAAIVEYLDRQYETGLTLAEQALAIYRRHGFALGVAKVLNAFGLLVAPLGRYDEAKAYYEEALVTYRAINNKVAEATILNNLGLVTFLAESFVEAETWYRQAQQMFEETGDRYGEALALYNRGRVAHRQKEYAQAAELHEQGLGIREEMERPYLCSISLLHLGRAQLAQGLIPQAEASLRGGLAQAVSVEAEPFVMYLLTSLGLIQQTRAEWETALLLAFFVQNHPASQKANLDFPVLEESAELIAAATAVLPATTTAKVHQQAEKATLTQLVDQLSKE